MGYSRSDTKSHFPRESSEKISHGEQCSYIYSRIWSAKVSRWSRVILTRSRNVDEHSKVPMACSPWPTIGKVDRRRSTNKEWTWSEQRVKKVCSISSGAVYQIRSLSPTDNWISLITCETFEAIQFPAMSHCGRSLSRMKARVEAHIRAQDHPSLFPYVTFVYVGFYYQNFLTFFRPSAELEFRVPLHPDARLPLYDVRDTGPVVAQCFAHPDRWGQRTIVPIVAQRLTMEEICQTIQHVTGDGRVRFVPLTPDQCVGQSKEYLDNLRWYNEYGEQEERGADKTREVYDQMKTFAQWIEETRWLMDEKKSNDWMCLFTAQSSFSLSLRPLRPHLHLRHHHHHLLLRHPFLKRK